MFRDIFVQAISARRKVQVRFFSKEDGAALTRVCAPMDYGPGRRTHDKSDRFWLWDYESDQGSHTLGLKPDQVLDLAILDEVFDPAEFVTWTPAWFVPRNWGAYS